MCIIILLSLMTESYFQFNKEEKYKKLSHLWEYGQSKIDQNLGIPTEITKKVTEDIKKGKSAAYFHILFGHLKTYQYLLEKDKFLPSSAPLPYMDIPNMEVAQNLNLFDFNFLSKDRKIALMKNLLAIASQFIKLENKLRRQQNLDINYINYIEKEERIDYAYKMWLGKINSIIKSIELQCLFLFLIIHENIGSESDLENILVKLLNNTDEESKDKKYFEKLSYEDVHNIDNYTAILDCFFIEPQNIPTYTNYVESQQRSNEPNNHERDVLSLESWKYILNIYHDSNNTDRKITTQQLFELIQSYKIDERYNLKT
jgi:hypothetical protein